MSTAPEPTSYPGTPDPAHAVPRSDPAAFVDAMTAELNTLQDDLAANRAQSGASRARMAPPGVRPTPPPTNHVRPTPPPTNHVRPNPVDMSSLGNVIDEIVGQAKISAESRVAEAQLEAEAIVRQAREEAALLRADAERIKIEAERDAQEYRVQTMAHASRVQNETEAALEKVRTDAAATMANIEHEVATELVARLQIVRESERAVLDRLAATADAINRCLAWFDEPSPAPRNDIDLRLAPSPTNGSHPN